MVSQEQPVQKIKETAPLNFIGLLPYKFTLQTQGVTKDQFKKQRLTRRVSQTMGRQRNNPQMKGKEEALERISEEQSKQPMM